MLKLKNVKKTNKIRYVLYNSWKCDLLNS